MSCHYCFRGKRLLKKLFMLLMAGERNKEEKRSQYTFRGTLVIYYQCVGNNGSNGILGLSCLK